MPILTREKWCKFGWVAAWQVDESESELCANLNLNALENARLDEIHHPKRRMEWLAMKNLLRHQMPELTIGYEKSGRPFSLYPGGNLSLSHTERIVAASFHPSRRAGIDLQAFDPKLDRIASRFVNEGERSFRSQMDERVWITGLWVIKEALFKCYGSGISFREQMWVGPFRGMENEVVAARVWVDGKVRHHSVKLRWFGKILCGMVIS